MQCHLTPLGKCSLYIILSFLLFPAQLLSSFLVFVLDTCPECLVTLDCPAMFPKEALRRWPETLSMWTRLGSQWPPHSDTSRVHCVELFPLGKSRQIPVHNCWHSVNDAREGARVRVEVAEFHFINVSIPVSYHIVPETSKTRALSMWPIQNITLQLSVVPVASESASSWGLWSQLACFPSGFPA